MVLMSMVKTACIGWFLTGAGVAFCAPTEILKEVPAKGTVRRGDIVYVDDGQCPAGQQTGVPRQVSCVKRPD
jgi:hypothetical protein